MHRVTRYQTLLLKQSDLREKLSRHLDSPAESRAATHQADVDGLTVELRALETDIRAAIVLDGETEIETTTETSEGRELAALEKRAKVSGFVSAAVLGQPVGGAELEYSQALGAGGRFPLQMLLPELRATTAADAGTTQGSWLDRVFAESAAVHAGVSMRSVGPGIASYPVTTAGAAAAQRGKSESTTAASWTLSVSELKPKRNSVRAVFNIEDAARLSGLEDALRRDLGAALVEGIDKAIFMGDATATGTDADIVGLNTAGITETTITQSDKVKGAETLQVFAAMIDGQYSAGAGDLRIVSSVGANTLWMGTVLPTPATTGETIAQFLRRSGIDWRVRNGIAAASGNNAFGAFVGRSRGIDGAGLAAIWESGDLIRDPYSESDKGEVAITFHYLWDFAVARSANFRRVKFVS